MPPSLLSANLARRAICPEWPAFHTRIPSPWPSPQGEGTGLWMLAISSKYAHCEHNNKLVPPSLGRVTVCSLLPLREKGWG